MGRANGREIHCGSTGNRNQASVTAGPVVMSMRVVLGIPPGVTMPRMAGALVVVMMDFAIAIGLGISPAMAVPVGRLRCGLTDSRADCSTDAATDNGAVTPAHGVANNGTGNSTDAATNRRPQDVGTCGGRQEEPGKQKRKEALGEFHLGHLLDRVKVRQR